MEKLIIPLILILARPDKLKGAVAELESHPIGLIVIALGLILIVVQLIQPVRAVFDFCYVYFFRPSRNLQRFGSWAVVTGATDGIGKAYCEALARKGLNLVLVSRTESKLKACEEEMRKKFNVKVKRCTADLTKCDDATFNRLEECLEGLDIGILVNNAGMSYDHPDYLDTIDNDRLRDIITINTLAPTRLAKLVLPGMKERRRGVIVNVGSGASSAIPAGPLISVYAGTKAYIDTLSHSLNAEYKEFGIRVQNQAPMFVATKLAKIRTARIDAPAPEAYARAAVAQIGMPETTFSPFWFHGLQIALIKLVPDGLILGYVLRLHKGMMRAFYRKQARKEVEEAAAATSSLSGDKKGQ